MKNIAEAKLC